MSDDHGPALLVAILAVALHGVRWLKDLKFQRSGERRAQDREGRELVAEPRAEEAHKLALEANERAKRAEARAEEAHRLHKQRTELELADVEATDILHRWLDEIRADVYKDPHPKAEVRLQKRLTTLAERLAATKLKERAAELKLHVKRDGDAITASAEVDDLPWIDLTKW